MATKNLPSPAEAFCTDRLTLHVIKFIDEQLARQAIMQLDRCSAFALPETSYGAGDAVPCLALGTVHDLAAEHDVCPRHLTAANGR